MDLLSKPSFRMLEQSLNAATLRQQVIAHNIANGDTPNFKRSELRFEELLERELSGQTTLEGYRTDPRHFYIGGRKQGGIPQSQIVRDDSTTMNNNQNNVDIDYEMALLAKNQLRYNTMAQQVNNELKKLRTVIGGR